MIQSKSFIVTGLTGTRFGRKETTLPGEIDKALNTVLDELGDSFKSVVVSPLGSAMSDSVLVTVLFEAEARTKTKKS
jgi:hypothetical protein